MDRNLNLNLAMVHHVVHDHRRLVTVRLRTETFMIVGERRTPRGQQAKPVTLISPAAVQGRLLVGIAPPAGAGSPCAITRLEAAGLRLPRGRVQKLTTLIHIAAFLHKRRPLHALAAR